MIPCIVQIIHTKDTDVLNDVVQEFINQIIFLRICEDRNLPLYQSLKETARNKVELQRALTKVFKEVDKNIILSYLRAIILF